MRESSYEEDMTLPMPPIELAKFLSAGKARVVAEKESDALIIAADTFVVYQNMLLGKPRTPERAKKMLQMLSGKENDIITGVTIIDSEIKREVSFHDTTKVFLKELSEETIDAYVATGEPLDKAGAYAIQEIGAVLIDHIEGGFFNAMGLPLSRLADELKVFGVNVL
jgi:septum formation protein